MNLSRTGCLLFGMTLAFGLWFRVYSLDLRPMHTDEAVHAEKFGELLEDGFYAYDPDEYHGPTLNYLTLPVARLRGQATYPDLDETTLRLVPAIFGTLLLLTPLLFFDGIGLRAAFFGTILLTFSPAFVFYSRYYIQEMLLVCFTAIFLGGMWRYLRSRRRRWILLAGIGAGLMHATKETCALTFSAVMLAMLLTLVLARPPIRFSLFTRDGLLGLLAAVVTSVLFFSSFGSHPDGVLDSVLTYSCWLNRAGEHSVHAHPWYWYFDLLTWNELTERITWNEDVLVAGALFGFFLAFGRNDRMPHRRFFCIFLALYTLVLTIIYSAIPYKTPWCVLTFLYGMALLAAMAADRFLRWLGRGRTTVLAIVILAGFGIVSPMLQSVFLNLRYCAHPSNPWVYAHTGMDIFKMDRAVRQAAAVHPDGKKMFIQVVAPGHDYWPLPWYLRDFEAVAYTDSVEEQLPNAPLVLCNASLSQQVLRKLYESPPPGRRELYVPLFKDYVELRPGVEWQGCVTYSLWEKMTPRPEPTASEIVPHSVQEPIVQTTPDRNAIPNLVKSSHQAMNAIFEVWIQHEDGTYAGRASRAAFNEVDRLEQELSRFIDNSDISRVNQARAGETVTVSPDTIGCLAVALQVYDLTDGAFDVTVGPLVRLWKEGQPTPQAIQAILDTRTGVPFVLNPDALTITVQRANVGIDLGGVGKGYAIDRIAQVLAEWGIERALIHGGASSVRAMNAPLGTAGWPIVLSNPHNPAEKLARLELADQVLSCSGLQRGPHIINPRNGQPVADKRAVWLVMTDSAARADALTTAFMVIPTEKIRDISRSHPEMSILVMSAEADRPPIRFGDWPR